MSTNTIIKKALCVPIVLFVWSSDILNNSAPVDALLLRVVCFPSGSVFRAQLARNADNRGLQARGVLRCVPCFRRWDTSVVQWHFEWLIPFLVFALILAACGLDLAKKKRRRSIFVKCRSNVGVYCLQSPPSPFTHGCSIPWAGCMFVCVCVRGPSQR